MNGCSDYFCDGTGLTSPATIGFDNIIKPHIISFIF